MRPRASAIIAAPLEETPLKLQYDAETEQFRGELRDWLQANLPPLEERQREPSISSAHVPEWARAWQQRQFDAGWLVPGWPPELGGRNATPVQQLVFFEEMARVPVQRSYNPQGLSIITPSIRDFASEALKARFVLPTLRAEITWCLGMSEPGAGSDLAGLSTRAEVRPDGSFVVTGQKVWTSGAAQSDFCFCFVRTDPDVPKHRGISVLVIDMKTPGIDVRPLAELVDPERADFNEVFFDGAVVPAENLVGQLDHGWSMAAGSLAHERGMLWTMQAGGLETRIERLKELGREPAPGGGRLGDDPKFRDWVAGAYVDVQALKFMGYRGFAKFARGQAAPEHSVLKLLGSELGQRICLEAIGALGASGLDTGPGASPSGPPIWALQYLHSFSGTIAGGTSEIQRSIIAQRVLGLPRR